MIKLLMVIGAFTVLSSKQICNKKTTHVACFRGKLEIKGPCMNYTISIIEGKTDTSMVAAKWIDESTGKLYHNVFSLGSRCNFPVTLKEGDEFYFKLDDSKVQDCAVCMMYYPVPPKQLAIQVFTTPCE